jgi:predicted phosphoribosyltransferase
VKFINRSQAGELLASRLTAASHHPNVVLGLARGGVVVAAPISRTLRVPLDALLVKKIPSPHNPELAIGALAPDDVSVIDWRMAHRVGADEAYLGHKKEILKDFLRAKAMTYRKGRKPVDVRGREVILVDDGAATGATIEAAVAWLRAKKAKKIVVALPVAPPEVVVKITPEVDDVIVLDTPEDLGAVGEYYDEFGEVADEEVVKLLV